MDFTPFPKVPRFMREIVVTEKLDGTNAQIHIRRLPTEDADGTFDVAAFHDGTAYCLRAGSRTRWICPGKTSDNFGFAAWVWKNADELAALGEGAHFGEWWGHGIGRGYGLNAHDKRWSLFNTQRWNTENVPDCCDVVPVLYQGPFSMKAIEQQFADLRADGSAAAEGFMRPEGIVVYHTAGNVMFKRTIEKDDVPKGGNHGS